MLEGIRQVLIRLYLTFCFNLLVIIFVFNDELILSVFSFIYLFIFF